MTCRKGCFAYIDFVSTARFNLFGEHGARRGVISASTWGSETQGEMGKKQGEHRAKGSKEKRREGRGGDVRESMSFSGGRATSLAYKGNYL